MFPSAQGRLHLQSLWEIMGGSLLPPWSKPVMRIGRPHSAVVGEIGVPDGAAAVL
jgi:hypothetical protein